MADKFRSNVEVIELEVNDDGYIVKLPVSDERFNQCFYEFTDNVQKKANEFETSIKNEDLDSLEKIKIDVIFHEYLKSEFEQLFGPGSYEAIFGKDVLVGVEYVLEFIEACLPYIEKHTKNRIDKFNKYSADRTGSSL